MIINQNIIRKYYRIPITPISFIRHFRAEDFNLSMSNSYPKYFKNFLQLNGFNYYFFITLLISNK